MVGMSLAGIGFCFVCTVYRHGLLDVPDHFFVWMNIMGYSLLLKYARLQKNKYVPCIDYIFEHNKDPCGELPAYEFL